MQKNSPVNSRISFSNSEKMHSDNLPKLDGFLPKQPRELYPSPSMCIYCGVKDNLSDETEWQTTLVDQKKYPFLITFPYFDTPGIVSRNQIHQSEGPVTKRLWIRGASPYYSFHELLEKLLVELKAYSVFPESEAEVPAFCKLLAKIAHAFAVAKIGLSGFTPALKPIIIQNNLSHCMHYIGSANKDEAPENKLHKLNILKFNSINAIFVMVRLLCKLGTPTYIVAVGTRK